MSSPNGDAIQRLSDIMAVEGIAPPHDQLRAAHEAVLSKWAKLAGKNFERNMNASLTGQQATKWAGRPS